MTITVVANGDTIDEGASENFFVNLSNSTNATISDTQGVGTITDDDTAALSMTDETVDEGDSGTTNMVFTVTIDKSSISNVTVQFATADGTATVVSNDYVSTNGTLTIPAGQTTGTITGVVNGDVENEVPFEIFYMNLSNAVNATISDSQGIGTIDDNDAVTAPTVDNADGATNITESGATLTGEVTDTVMRTRR